LKIKSFSEERKNMDVKSLKLMIPGPIQPDESVLEAMGSPVRAHYGPEFRDFYNETVAALKQVFLTEGDVHLLVGSGSAGIDACLGSALASGEKILIGVNGFFGERLFAIAENYNLQVVPVRRPWGSPLRAEDFALELDRHPDAQLVAIVHLETSTTIVNPVEEIGSIVRKKGVPFFVDTVSSLGGLPFEMDEWGVDLCATASQKCLGAPPGISPVAVGERGWEMIDRQTNKGHGWYLNLRVWRQYTKDWADWHPFPITQATNNIVALKTSLDQLLDEGIRSRQARYTRIALRLREGLRRIGMPPYTPDDCLAPVITAAYGPPGIPTSQLVNYLSEVHGIKIAGGLGVLKDKVFRIGHMSPTVTEADIDQVLEALADFRSAYNV
jgi:alanine-glyoxylate transaminase / serine-glyoxylate transaminase / serine-pyruvate transaminase